MKVILPSRKGTKSANWNSNLVADGWNACLDEIAKLNSLDKSAEPIECFCVEHGLHIQSLQKEVADLKAKMATMVPKPHTRVFTHKTLVGEGWSFVGSDGGKWYNSREKAVAAAYAQGFIVDNEEG